MSHKRHYVQFCKVPVLTIKTFPTSRNLKTGAFRADTGLQAQGECGGVMRLYSFFRSSAAFRVRIGLNLKGLAYDTAAIHLRRNDQSTPDYRGVNPQGLVPALEDGGQTLI